MPDIYAHILCAEGALDRLPLEVTSIIKEYMAPYRLGAQGPDFFFYYNAEPWNDDEGFSKIGGRVHTESIDEFFITAADYIKEGKDSLPKETLNLYISYLAGFLTHYALDSTAHPYIYYTSGINAGNNHKYLEGSIDTLLMLYYGSRNSGKLIKQTQKNKVKIAEFISYLLSKVFDLKIPKHKIAKSFDDISKIISMLYDPNHLKKPIISKLDKKLSLKGKVISAITPTKLIKGVDYLNLKKKTWYNPSDDSIQSNESFLELHEKAKILSAELIKSMYTYVSGEPSEFPKNIGNKSYDTGLPGKHKKVYEDVIIHWQDAYFGW